MIKASEAYSISQKCNQLKDILEIAEEHISAAAESGDYECVFDIPDSYRKNVEPAINLIKDAGYDVRCQHTDMSEEADGSDWRYVISINWENAEL